jgi:mannose-6-phosphate isomerase class I
LQTSPVLEIICTADNTGTSPSTPEKTLYRVQTGAFSVKKNADALLAKVKAAGFETYMVKVNGLYKVQVGAFSVKTNADAMAAKLKAKGFDVYITTKGGTPVTIETPKAEIKVGSKVMVKSGAKTYTGGNLSSFVYKTVYDVIQMNGDRVVIGLGKAITAAVKKGDLILK